MQHIGLHRTVSTDVWVPDDGRVAVRRSWLVTPPVPQQLGLPAPAITPEWWQLNPVSFTKHQNHIILALQAPT